MRAPISVIIPTLNAGKELPACLMALGEGLKEGLIRELIVSDGGSTDTTLQTAQAAGATIVNCPPSRGGQFRRGAEASKGHWLLFIHPDTQLSPEWAQHAQAHFASKNAACFQLNIQSRHPMARLIGAWANFRTRAFQLPYSNQALLLTRELYDQIGGYPDQPVLEDLAIARALKGRITLLPALACISAARYEHGGWLRVSMANLTLLARYAMGTPPETLAKRYRKKRS